MTSSVNVKHLSMGTYSDDMEKPLKSILTIRTDVFPWSIQTCQVQKESKSYHVPGPLIYLQRPPCAAAHSCGHLDHNRSFRQEEYRNHNRCYRATPQLGDSRPLSKVSNPESNSFLFRLFILLSKSDSTSYSD